VFVNKYGARARRKVDILFCPETRTTSAVRYENDFGETGECCFQIYCVLIRGNNNDIRARNNNRQTNNNIIKESMSPQVVPSVNFALGFINPTDGLFFLFVRERYLCRTRPIILSVILARFSHFLRGVCF